MILCFPWNWKLLVKVVRSIASPLVNSQIEDLAIVTSRDSLRLATTILGARSGKLPKDDCMRRWPATRGAELVKLHCTHTSTAHTRKSEIMYIISAVSIRMPASFTPEPI
jgi:hypothetical protein